MINVDVIKIVNFHGCLLIALVIFLIPFLLMFVYRKIRPKFSVKVECWFCAASSSVPYGNRNCWDCVTCEQYNGFKNDGDYNKPIPAQFDEDLNFPIMGKSPKGERYKSWSNGLCIHCNANQVVKLKLVSSFVPINADKEDEEYKQYIHHLDKLYSLCWHCDIHTQKFLSKQDAILRNSLPPEYNRNAIELLEDTPIKSFNLPKATYIFSIISFISLIPLFIQSINELRKANQMSLITIPESILDYVPQNSFALFIGFISTTVSICLVGRDRWHINDALLTLFWVILQVFYSDELINPKFYQDYLVFARPVMIVAIVIFSFITYYIKLRQFRRVPKNVMKTFKLQKPTYSPSPKSVTSTCDDSFSTDDESSSDPLLPLDASLNAVHITPPNDKRVPYQGDIGYEFEISHMKQNYPIIRPARFNPRSITHSSWVAGGFWSLPVAYHNKITTPDGTALKYAMNGYQSSSLFTPPPSVSSSQESRATSAAGSYCNGDWQSSSAASIRSWPPSFYTNKLEANRYAPSCRSCLTSRASRHPSQISQTYSKSSVATMTMVPKSNPVPRKWMKLLISLCVGCSLFGNFLFLNYYLSWPFSMSLTKVIP